MKKELMMFVMMFVSLMFVSGSATVVPDHDVGDQIVQMDQSPVMGTDQLINDFQDLAVKDSMVAQKTATVEPDLINEPIASNVFFHGDVGWYDSPVFDVEQPPSQTNSETTKQNKDPSKDRNFVIPLKILFG